MANKRGLISVVVPVYNEARNLTPLHKELNKTLQTLPYDFELIFVDDGSTDSSAMVLRGLESEGRNIQTLQFARNFGKEAAVSAGLHHAKGDAAIVIDADMQMPPSLMREFIRRWEQGAEIVVGVFAARSMQWTRRLGAKIFYRIMQTIGHTKITPHATDYRLLDRQVIDTFNQLPEHNRITRGMIDWLGYECSYVHFKQAARLYGKPNYSFSSLIRLAINGFTAYSLVPLKMAGYLGVIILALSIPATIFLYVMRFVLGNPLHWTINSTTFLAMLILFLIGIVLACLGLMSLYIANIYAEVINRPLYVVRRRPKIKAVETKNLKDNEQKNKAKAEELRLLEGAAGE
jgi:polyisoprenyl-phosphate glycosyltransferase